MAPRLAAPALPPPSDACPAPSCLLTCHPFPRRQSEVQKLELEAQQLQQQVMAAGAEADRLRLANAERHTNEARLKRELEDAKSVPGLV